MRVKLLLPIILLGAMPASGGSRRSVPPDPYVVTGHVPAGFSGFGVWIARRETRLYATPGARTASATVARCEEVTAEAGEIRGHPWPMRALQSHPPFRKGERIWVLARGLEEGYFQLWYRGEVRDDLAAALDGTPPFAQQNCSRPSAKCWLWADKEPRQEHWVRMQRKDGSLGWSDRAEDFGEGPAKAFACP
jgi:hypothetical protein